MPVEISTLNEQHTKEYRILDNKISEKTDWVTEDLMMEIREIGNIDHMQQFFNVDLGSWLDTSVGMTADDVTENDVSKVQDNLDNQFKGKVEQTLDNMIEITCPHCLETIEVTQKQLEDKLK